MSTATVRIPENKRDVLKVIATLEKREMKEISKVLLKNTLMKLKILLNKLKQKKLFFILMPI